MPGNTHVPAIPLLGLGNTRNADGAHRNVLACAGDTRELAPMPARDGLASCDLVTSRFNGVKLEPLQIE